MHYHLVLHVCKFRVGPPYHLMYYMFVKARPEACSGLDLYTIIHYHHVLHVCKGWSRACLGLDLYTIWCTMCLLRLDQGPVQGWTFIPSYMIIMDYKFVKAWPGACLGLDLYTIWCTMCLLRLDQEPVQEWTFIPSYMIIMYYMFVKARQGVCSW